jgi:hypothetical protein
VLGSAQFALRFDHNIFDLDNIIPLEATTYALSVGTTIISTLIILIQILRVPKLPGSSRGLQTAAEIIVESAALYCISTIIYLVMLFTDTTGTYFLYAELFFANMAVCSPPSPSADQLTSPLTF